MQQYLVALKTLPVADVAASAAAWVRALGGTQADATRALRTCDGVLMERLDADRAKRLVAALRSAGCEAWALPQQLIPRPPKPRVASALDLSQPDTIGAQIALTGPPQRIPWSKVVLVMPAVLPLERHKMVSNKPARVGVGRAAIALSTGIGAKKVMGAVRERVKGGPDTLTETETEHRRVVEIWSVNPWARVQAFQDRLDYSALPGAGPSSRDNFITLLATLGRRSSPQMTGRGLLAEAVRAREVPAACHGADNNGVGAIGRWLLLRAAAMRLEARRAGGSTPNPS